MSTDRARAYALLALALREIQHNKIMASRVVCPPWWQFWRSCFIEEGQP